MRSENFVDVARFFLGARLLGAFFLTARAKTLRRLKTPRRGLLRLSGEARSHLLHQHSLELGFARWFCAMCDIAWTATASCARAPGLWVVRYVRCYAIPFVLKNITNRMTLRE